MEGRVAFLHRAWDSCWNLLSLPLRVVFKQLSLGNDKSRDYGSRLDTHRFGRFSGRTPEEMNIAVRRQSKRFELKDHKKPRLLMIANGNPESLDNSYHA